MSKPITLMAVYHSWEFIDTFSQDYCDVYGDIYLEWDKLPNACKTVTEITDHVNQTYLPEWRIRSGCYYRLAYYTIISRNRLLIIMTGDHTLP